MTDDPRPARRQTEPPIRIGIFDPDMREFLDYAHRVVSGWPEWMRNCLGGYYTSPPPAPGRLRDT